MAYTISQFRAEIMEEIGKSDQIALTFDLTVWQFTPDMFYWYLTFRQK